MNRFIISENERNNILGLHKNFLLSEQATTPPLTTTAPTNYTIKQLQELLNSKGFNVGIADGKAGAKTLAGLQQALAVIAKSVVPPVQQPLQQQGQVQTQQQVTTPAQTATQVTTPAQSTSLAFNPSALGGTAAPTAPGVS